MRWVFSLLVLIGAAPASQPASQPDEPPTLDQLSQRSIEAAHAVSRARDECLSRLRGTPKYKALAAERDSNEAILHRARESGTPEDRLDASRDFVKAKKAVDDAEESALDDDDAFQTAKRNVREAEADERLAKIEDLRRTFAADGERNRAIENDPILRAIRDHRVIRGMDLEQAKRAMGDRVVSVTDAGDEKTLQWRRRGILTTAAFNKGICVVVSEDAE